MSNCTSQYTTKTVIYRLREGEFSTIDFRCFEEVPNPPLSEGCVCADGTRSAGNGDSHKSCDEKDSPCKNNENGSDFVLSENLENPENPSFPTSSADAGESGIEGLFAQIPTKPVGTFWVGFDAEWKNEGKTNRILSYQFWFEDINIGLILLINGRKLFIKELLKVLCEFLSSRGIKKVKNIHLISHFARAECFALDLRRSINKEGVRNLRTVQGSIVSVDYDNITFHDINRNKKIVNFKLFDSNLLAGKCKLEELGKVIGIEKIENKNFIEHMDELLEKDFPTYVEYSILDSVISVKFVIHLFESLRKEFGIDKHFITASQISEVLFTERVRNYHALLGYQEETTKVYCPKTGRWYPRKQCQLPTHIELGRDAYYGGRSETYFHGYNKSLIAYDYDIKNAYPSSMLTLADIDWSRGKHITSPKEIESNDVGYARVKFKFKPNIQYPFFPIETQYGLIFPLEGETTITLPELYAAHRNDTLEELEILDSRVYQKKAETTIPTFIKDLILKRKQHPSGSIENLLYKLIANSFYGKTAQGINPKTAINLPKSFNSERLVREEMKRSRIYNPFIAGYITGFTRALVGEYLIYFQRNGIDVINVTTDGFMISRLLTDEELKGVGPLSKYLSDIRRLHIKDDYILELKHQGKGILALKTRGYLMREKDGEADQRLLAKPGIQTPKGLSKDKEIDYIFETYLKAHPGMKYEQTSLSNIEDFLLEGIEDLIELKRKVSINVDYDLKRQPIKPQSVDITYEGNSYKKVKFATKPHRDLQEFLTARKSYENFKKHRSSNNKIQTLEDYHTFVDYQKCIQIADTYATNSLRDVILNKVIMCLKILGVKEREIYKTLGIQRVKVRDTLKSKTFQAIQSGKKSLKKIPLHLMFECIPILDELLSNFEPEIREQILSVLAEVNVSEPVGVGA
jgi:hypothetical protein